mmetsp:Transcript_45985/g.132612  ORF Transcript_45985/g.132612 Transcript_45985/m.132612 type:complete len:236 (-) Transcript_45985:314-1021(-)
MEARMEDVNWHRLGEGVQQLDLYGLGMVVHRPGADGAALLLPGRRRRLGVSRLQSVDVAPKVIHVLPVDQAHETPAFHVGLRDAEHRGQLRRRLGDLHLRVQRRGGVAEPLEEPLRRLLGQLLDLDVRAGQLLAHPIALVPSMREVQEHPVDNQGAEDPRSALAHVVPEPLQNQEVVKHQVYFEAVDRHGLLRGRQGEEPQGNQFQEHVGAVAVVRDADAVHHQPGDQANRLRML